MTQTFKPTKIIPVLALIVAGAVLALVLFAGTDSYLVKAELRDAGGLRVNASVKIGGVPAGKVESLEITKHDTAIATLSLQPTAAPIGPGATIKIRPTDLLGERYADLNPGNRSQALPSGSFIPVSRTSQPVELDDVLNTLNLDTRTRLRILINEAGIALTGNGAQFSQLLNVMPPSLSAANGLLSQVAGENQTLRALIAEGDRVTATVNGRRDQMRTLISNASSALDTVAQRRAQLGATLEAAPAGISALTDTLSRLQSASISLRPAAADIQSLAAPLTRTLDLVPSFASSATGTLDRATALGPVLSRFAVQANTPLARLRPMSRSLDAILRLAGKPLTQVDQRGMKDVLWFLQNWALGLKGRDGFGHFIGAKLSIDPSVLISTLASVEGKNTPTFPARHRVAPRTAPKAAPALTQVPAVTLPAPALKLPKLPTVPGITGTLKRTIQGTLAKLGVAPTTQKVQNALHQAGLPSSVTSLLGGGSPPGSGGANGDSSQSMQALLDYLLR